MNTRAFLRERLRSSDAVAMMPGGASIAHVFGTVLVVMLGMQALTGAGLAAFYSPSTTDAWASVAYIQDQAWLGWLVRGLHAHGASALVIISGLHLVQTAVAGAYKRPRELVWWLGVLLLVLVIVWAVTGYVLRWDQAGYWANQVEIRIAAESPVIGELIRTLALGGNDYGNLTLTRFYALHVIVLPALVLVVTVVHVRLSRRHGPTAVRDAAPVPRWPHQSLRDVVAVAIVLSVLLAYVVSQHGIDLASPADPTAAYDARPLWYFRWLFALREAAGSAAMLAALGAPAITVGFLIALPLLDRGADRAPRTRKLWLGGLAGMVAVVGGLTVASFAKDANDAAYSERVAKATVQAGRARALAKAHGVPVTGALDVWKTPPMWRARTLFASHCAGCHDAAEKDRKGPVIAPGHGDRAWLTAFLHAPSGDAFWGRTKLAHAEEAMKAVELPASDITDVVELLYAESGAADVDAARRERGAKVFESACTDCHTLEEGVSGPGPALAGLGSRAYFRSFIGNPKSGLHMSPAHSEMPRFDADLTLAERDELAGYLVWLRTATSADLARLGPL